MEIKTITHKNILLVENDPEDLKLTLNALEEIHLGGKAMVVRNGEEALDYLCQRGAFKDRMGGDPVLILLDLKMPKVNGLEVLKILKADEHLKTIPVVMLTSSPELSDVTNCYRHGANAYVVKPMDITEFMTTVHRLGVFWTAVNEPPPQNGKAEIKHEIPPSHPLPGG